MTLKEDIKNALDEYFTTPDEARQIAEDVHGNGSGGNGELPANFVGKGDTIQEAHDSLGNHWTDSGRIFVLPGYDPVDEDYPIVWTKRASLHGGNYTDLKPSSGEYAIVVNMGAANNRPPGPTFHNFSVTGGGGGCKIKAGRYSVWENVDVNKVEEDGYHITGKDWGEEAVNSHHFYSCFTDSAGRDGFHIGMRAHGAHLYACQSYFAGRHGVYVGEATNCGMFGGSTEQATEEGLYLDSSHVFLAKGVYFEASNKDSSGGAEAHVTDGASSVSFENCYFNGFGKVDWGARFFSGANCNIENCEAWNYNRGFIYVDNACDVDINQGSHHIRDGTKLLGQDDGATVRSSGILLPKNLRQVDGRFDGDMAIHLQDGNPHLCTWHNGQWYIHYSEKLGN